jgi:hypothetical protein
MLEALKEEVRITLVIGIRRWQRNATCCLLDRKISGSLRSACRANREQSMSAISVIVIIGHHTLECPLSPATVGLRQQAAGLVAGGSGRWLVRCRVGAQHHLLADAVSPGLCQWFLPPVARLHHRPHRDASIKNCPKSGILARQQHSAGDYRCL